jgi:hypothetical protein
MNGVRATEVSQILLMQLSKYFPGKCSLSTSWTLLAFFQKQYMVSLEIFQVETKADISDITVIQGHQHQRRK